MATDAMIEKLIYGGSDTIPKEVDPEKYKDIRKKAVRTAALLAGAAGASATSVSVALNDGPLWLPALVGLLFATAGAGFASASKDKKLCHEKPGRLEGVWKDMGAGAGAGAGVVGVFTPIFPKLAPLLLGIIGLAAIIPGVRRVVSNMRDRGNMMNCPRPFCKKKQACGRAVCRACLRIFYPAAMSQCELLQGLNWYQIASALDSYGLTYIESLELVTDHWGSNKLGPTPYHDPTSNEALVDCEEFKSWLTTNKAIVKSYVHRTKASDLTTNLLDELKL